MKIILKYSLVFCVILAIATACTETVEYSETPEMQVFFSYTADSYVVTFANESKLKGPYMWDFGDGTVSSEKSPVHDFGKKGKYIVTLSTVEGTVAEATTVMLLDKTSKVKLDDNTLSDWDEINKNVVTSGIDGMGVKKGKFDYDANYIYIYIEQNAIPDNNTIIDLFIDGDNSKSTGYVLGIFPGMGAEYLIEGQLSGESTWADFLKYTGTGTSWDWGSPGVNDFYKTGYFEEKDGIYRYEFAISRTKIPELTNESARIGINVLDSGWGDFGYMPDKNSSGYLLMMNE